MRLVPAVDAPEVVYLAGNVCSQPITLVRPRAVLSGGFFGKELERQPRTRDTDTDTNTDSDSPLSMIYFADIFAIIRATLVYRVTLLFTKRSSFNFVIRAHLRCR